MTVTQADLAPLRAAGRLGEYAVVYRVNRNHRGGGFGDQTKHPLTWAVLVYVDNQAARIHSARGKGREWSGLDRLQRWLREQGFWYWWTRNDVEPLGMAAVEVPEEEFPDAPAHAPLTPLHPEPPGAEDAYLPPPGPPGEGAS
jgi:hypothetical protein